MRRLLRDKALAAALLFAQLAGAIPTTSLDHGMMSMNGLLGRQAPEGFDPYDLSFITKLAAVGDSYSAGIGAGDRLGNALGVFVGGSGQYLASFNSTDEALG